MSFNEYKKAVSPLQNEADRLSRLPKICFKKGCNLETIPKSHIVQENGIIDKIAENFLVHQLIGRLYNEHTYRLDRLEMANAYTFRGFCSEHDGPFFEKIEKFQIDFNDYESQLLLSYRSLLYKIREREIAIGIARYDLSSKFHEKANRTRYMAEEVLYRYEQLLSYLIEDKELIESNIENPKLQDYFFMKKVIPRIKICCSQYFGFQWLDYKLLRQVFITRIPVRPTGIFFSFDSWL